MTEKEKRSFRKSFGAAFEKAAISANCATVSELILDNNSKEGRILRSKIIPRVVASFAARGGYKTMNDMIKRFLVVAGAVLFASCAREETTDKGNENLPIMFSATFSTASNTQSRATATAFEGGDELGLFVVKSGMEVQMEGNLVNNHKMVVGGDGVIKGTPTAVYYPTQQGTSSLFKTNLYSYYPYQSGDATADALGVLVGIRTDQTDFSSVKRSDLCYGSSLDIAPSKAAQPLSFKHSFSQVRVNVTLFAGCPAVKQLRLINIKDSATLNIQTGALTLKSHTAEVLTYPNTANSPTSFTAIIPAQTLAGACVAIDLVDNNTTYIYNAVNPINLAQSATNTLNLSVNDKGVITLNGDPTISAWGNNSNSGNLSESVNNQISLYWLAPHADYATADKITLSTTDPLGVIRDIDLIPTLDPASSADYAVYKLNLTLSGTTYPLVINRIRVHKGATILSDCSEVTLVGKVLYKSGPHVLAIDANRAAIKINNLIWATGNLVANGPNSCKIGQPGDGGLYFQYGGLIGYKGGATGDGTGICNAATHPDGKWWGGAAAYSANDVAVKPAGYASKATWPYYDGVASGGFGYYYFNTLATKYADFQAQANANNPALGIGDPCAHYLGSPWRLPTYVELSAITGSTVETNWVPWSTAGVTGRWEKTNGPKSATGAWFGPNSRTGTPTTNTDLFIPASGYRYYNSGSFRSVGPYGCLWSSSAYDYYRGFTLDIDESRGVRPHNGTSRAFGVPVRCVKN